MAKRGRVLVVEDNPDMLEFTMGALELLEWPAVGVMDGASALAELDVSDDFVVLLTDVKLPGTLDGAAVAQAVRRRSPHIAIVFASGYTDRAVDRELLKALNARLLNKPFLIDTLEEALNAAEP